MQASPITTYEWDDKTALVSRVDVRAHDKHSAVAYLYAGAAGIADAEKLRALRDRFQEKGWVTSSDNRDGKSVLRVMGLENGQQMLDLLQTENGVNCPPKVSEHEKEQRSATQRLLSGSLRASALFYILGDIVIILAGAMREIIDHRTANKEGIKNRHSGRTQMAMGGSFAVGDGLLMAFGGKDDTRQFHSLLSKLKSHLQDRGIPIPDSAALTAETMAKPHGFLESIYDFMHENINSLKIVAEMAGGAFGLWSGKDQKNPQKKASGILIVTGWTAALLIKEKKRDKEKEQEQNLGPLEKIGAYIQEKPLRLAGGAGLGHNALTLYGIHEERLREKDNSNDTLSGAHPYQLDFVSTCIMLVANGLYAVSNKVTGGKIDSHALTDDVYGIAAQVLSRQAPEVQERAIDETARYLGTRPEIKDSHEQIAARLRSEIETHIHNPWFYPLEKAAHTASQNTAPGRG